MSLLLIDREFLLSGLFYLKFPWSILWFGVNTDLSNLEISVKQSSLDSLALLLALFANSAKTYVNDVIAPFRAYRIGQCRDVTVLRLISLGTVEEIIYLRQVYKQVGATILNTPDYLASTQIHNYFCLSVMWNWLTSQLKNNWHFPKNPNCVLFQQLQCTVVGKESARRYFEAVQGDDDHKGELFGLKNLFRMQVNGTCLTRKILEVRLLAEL